MTLGSTRSLVAAIAIALGAVLSSATPASAQYFGRNKVRYETFDFKVLKTQHFDVYYYEEERTAAELSARMAERWYERLSRLLDHQLSRRQPLILYDSHPRFEQTAAIPGDIGEGTGGVTEFMKRRIVLPLAGSLAETDHVIGHELVHAFQLDITGQSRAGSGVAGPTMARLPLWFIEGMAEYLSIGPVDPHTAMWMRDAARANKLPTIDQLFEARYFPYRYGQAVWAYLAGRFGDDIVGQALKASGRTADASRALAVATGIGPDTLSREWHQALRDWYAPIGAVTEPSSAIARRVITGSEATRYNIAPAVSPDGRWIVFLSERSQFSIEMFLADATTGKVVRTLTKAALDPHLQSLQFIQSAGSFSPDGKRFAYATVQSGRPVLNVYDLDQRREVREIEFKDLGEIFHPTWSPDGGRIAFSAQVGGVTDLFVVDLGSRRRRRLTDDAYSAIEPAWSPDGRRIAFVTDRFTTRLEDLSLGEPELALIDVESGEVTRLPALSGSKHVNPQWSRDGSSLYFVGDPDGISNVYRLAVPGGEVRQVTNLATGVSGITPLSPAISVARDADRLVMSVYENGSYHLDAIDSRERLAGGPLRPLPSSVKAAALPPVERHESEVRTLISNPGLGLETATSFQRTGYRASLSLDNVTNVGVGLGVSGGNVAVGGGAVLYWSDMLGDHNLVTLVQLNNAGSSFTNNLAAGVGYWNLRSRWDWGFQVSQFPTITRDFILDAPSPGVVRERDFRRFQIERDALLRVAYPFSRVQRLELSGGFRNIDFAGEVEENVFDEFTGQLLSSDTRPLADDSLRSLNLGLGSLALVYDNSFFGGTSPLLGQRYRFEVTPVAGGLNFTGVLADYRRYIPLVRPLVFAGRAYHFGRYGKDAEDPVLSDLFLGYPWLVRGYDDNSFTIDECDGTDDCPAFDRLLGSRIALANLELRLPLIGGVGLVRAFGVPPIEVAGFFDVGAAWREGEKSPFASGGRDPVTSHGVALRINLLGFAVAEIDYVHPNDRPNKGWYWEVNLQPGF